MKCILFALVAAIVPAAPAQAENLCAGQEVRAGRRDCHGCDLFQSDLSYLDLRGRSFVGARLRQSNMSLAEVDNANLAGANLSFVDSFGARFASARLDNADLRNGNFVGAYFGNASLRGVLLDGAILSGADFSGARGLTQAQISKACGESATVLPAGITIAPCK
jgi:uncharacterized protein YjbI with pentapeptide repeats